MISLAKSTNLQPTTYNEPTTTTASSDKLQSTLMPPNLADHIEADNFEADHSSSNSKSSLNTENLLNKFKISSSHNMAILSRTERSIRTPSSSSSASSANISSWGNPLVLSENNRSNSSSNSSSKSHNSSRGSRGSSALVGGGLVRRSSDMGVLKSKRLNNSRNLHHKNNLDRNERSTVSHLSGPSRKIQLYIKNRFLQLLPDSTVNGTQDEQCDYSK